MSVNSPLAKYSSTGQLICVICNGPVKSEKLWTAHLAGREHKRNVAAMKAKKMPEAVSAVRSQNGTKRPMTGESSGRPSKIAKSLSDSLPTDFFDGSTTANTATVPLEQNSSASVAASEVSAKMSEELGDKSDTPWVREQREKRVASVIKGPDPNTAEALPEGFFDDKALDAKVRNVEPKADIIDEEFARFQKEMKILEQTPNEEEDQQEEIAHIDKDIEEIDTQIMEWNRVNDLQQKKDTLAADERQRPNAEQNIEDSAQSSSVDKDNVVAIEDDDMDFDALADWRSKLL